MHALLLSMGSRGGWQKIQLSPRFPKPIQLYFPWKIEIRVTHIRESSICSIHLFSYPKNTLCLLNARPCAGYKLYFYVRY